MIAALYVATNGCYFGLPNVDPWDVKRDARLYAGPWPVVAHPPCARWCLMAGMVETRGGKRVGDDDGCFAAALESVRRWGGVLEHPAYSQAFLAHGLARPVAGDGWQRTLCGGWTTQVDQGRYGHAANKPTWIYVHGLDVPPRLDWKRADNKGPQTEQRNSRSGRPLDPLDRMSKRKRSATPLAFRDLLISIAETANRKLIPA